jgi:hypothetical protein
VLLAGCRYGFSGGGLPRSIRTIAIVPFENETATPDLQRELTQALREEMGRRLGLREDAEARAHAVVRGTILRYEPDVPISFSADPNQTASTRRQLQIAVDLTIVDQSTGRTLLERRGLSANGEYGEGSEPAGRRLAIEKLVDQIIQGIQSQW